MIVTTQACKRELKELFVSMKDWKQFAMNPDKLIGSFDQYLTLVVNPNSSKRRNSEC